MNIVTGCSGIDAIAYAALLLDMELIGQIEIDAFCNTILELRYPGVKRYKNIFDVRGDEFGAVDIFAAGIPCQPFSHAGKREGTEDDRYLWPEAIRIIRVMQPTWVIIEIILIAQTKIRRDD
jgi:DNA (cytosine-5)-methyltransferase 1